MDTYANILLITIPIFLVLITIEILYGAWKKNQQHSFMDTISSLSSGFTNLLVDILGDDDKETVYEKPCLICHL